MVAGYLGSLGPMLRRYLTLLAIAFVCAVVTFALWYVDNGDFSLLLGSLLFVALSFFLRRASIVGSLAFAAVVALFVPYLAVVASFVPVYGLNGAFACVPGLFGAPAQRLSSVASALIFAGVSHVILRASIGP